MAIGAEAAPRRTEQRRYKADKPDLNQKQRHTESVTGKTKTSTQNEYSFGLQQLELKLVVA
jgi:hypothetical protein